MLILRGGGQSLKRSALLSKSSKIALSLVILAPLVSPLSTFNPPVYAAASLQTNGSNLTIDIDKNADETASLTGTTTSTTTVTTSNAVGYTLTAAINDASLQTLTNNNIEFSLSGADVSDLSFDTADKTEKLLVTNTATATTGDAANFTLTVTVPATIDAGVYVIDINYNAVDNLTRVVYTDNTEELIIDLATFVAANSKTNVIPNVNVNGVVKIASTIKGVYLYGEVPIRTNFFRAAFRNCTNLVEVDFKLTLNNNNNVTDWSYYFALTFMGCTSLNTAIDLPAIPSGMTGVTNLNNYLGSTFYGCTSLDQAINLPAIPSGMTGVTNLSGYLGGTFRDCTSLNTAIDLPAIPSGMTNVTDLRNYLEYTFFGCTQMTNASISNIAPCDAGAGTPSISNITANYAYYTQATPVTPITNLEGIRAGYNYH